ncbi:DALR anticodon-binding domain-containing protein [Streptosporangium saharense]|uniref:DALR anticodon-binding domain-containing protein n=1 Tax=Streptosporangium saharense TaxID=1706840 RepID=UPI0036B63292
MTVGLLGEVLGAPPAPRGTWEKEALYVSAAGLRGRETPEALAARVRDLPGITEARVRPGGWLEIVVAVPGELLTEIEAVSHPCLGEGPGWPDFPRTWRNPGFVVRYACVRAAAVRRWAGELGVGGPFRPELLDGRWDRAVLRVLAELYGRRGSRDPGWAAYAEQLALAYHDAFEHAPALPVGDEEPSASHAARVRLAWAVREVLGEALSAIGETVPDRL